MIAIDLTVDDDARLISTEDRELEQLARRAYGDDVEVRYLTGGDEDCRRSDLAIVREHESGFVQRIDSEVDLLPDHIEEARALLRARLLDVLGEGASDPQCGECGESHGDLAEGAVS